MIDYKSRKIFKPKHIYVEKSIVETELSQRILDNHSDLKHEIINDANDLLDKASAAENKNPWQGAILLAKQRGPFLRYCPGTQKHICCMYYNLDVAAGCDLNCTYCVLQGYINNPLKTFYCNTGDMYKQLDNALAKENHFYRIGTGELSDSLSFDFISEISIDLVNYFSNKKNAIIELKTKSVQIDNLLNLDHGGRAVISWSLNAPDVWQTEESQTPTLEDRLLAAAEVQKCGYKLGFHFDPMIVHDNWQEGYRYTVDLIFKYIKPENIAWISLGALRYPHAFDEVLRENHPQSEIVLGELLPGIDRKLRYFMPLRAKMFSAMYNWIRSYSPDVFVYLCMESQAVWEKSFGWTPKSSAELKRLLDDRVI